MSKGRLEQLLTRLGNMLLAFVMVLLQEVMTQVAITLSPVTIRAPAWLAAPW